MPPISRSNMYLGILCIVFAALVAFVWTLRHHQYDDLEGDAERPLRDEEL